MHKIGRVTAYEPSSGTITIAPLTLGPVLQVHVSRQTDSMGRTVATYSVPAVGSRVQYKEKANSVIPAIETFIIMNVERWGHGWKMRKSQDAAAKIRREEAARQEQLRLEKLATQQPQRYTENFFEESNDYEADRRARDREDRIKELEDEAAQPDYLKRTYHSQREFDEAFDDYWSSTRDK